MSAIAGALGAPFDKLGSAVLRAGERLRHRGPDGVRSVELALGDGRGLSLWSCRLATTDRSPDAKSLVDDAASGVHVALAGSIYNCAALRRELQGKGIEFARPGDAEVVLRAYLAWGHDALLRIEGAFALALFDPRDNALLLARDRLGFRPLYFGTVEQAGERAVVFASELRALLATNLFARRLDRSGFETFAWNGVVMAPHTMVQGVSCALPGTCMRIDARQLLPQARRYWRVPDHVDGAAGVPELRQALLQAVGRHLEADAEVGCFLSGGIDSSAVVALATTVANRRVRTFNVAFEETAFDESGYARAVAQALGTEHREIRLSAAFFRQHLEDALHALDQPSFDGLNTYMASKAVREAGVGVALGGTGGDDLFGGNRTFIDIPKTLRLGRALRFMPECALDPLTRVVARWKAGRASSVPAQTRWGKVRDVAVAGGNLLETYQVAYALFTDRFLSRLIPERAPDVRAGLPTSRLTELRSLIENNSLPYGIAMLELSLFVADHLLRDIDCVSMSVGLETRLPLLDERVLSVWRSVDEALLFEPPLKKQALRDAALQRLDPSLFGRAKAGFVLPFEHWCRQSLKSIMDDVFRDREHMRSLGLNADAVSTLWQAYQRGEPGLYWSRVWALFVALWWCRTYGVRL